MNDKNTASTSNAHLMGIDISDAPIQNSPKHILSILNDHCIQEILLKIENISDFLNAAEVCKRFHQNSKVCFPERFKKILISDTDHSFNTLSLDVGLPILLNHFGYLLESISWCKTIDVSRDQDTFNMIAEFCARTLKTLKIKGHAVDFNFQMSFQALETFETWFADVRNFNSFSQLKRLSLYYVEGSQFDWLVREFPKLEKVEFVGLYGLKVNVFDEFLQLNSQLRFLKIEQCDTVTSTALQDISCRTPNLKHLTLRLPDNHKVNLMNLSGLRELKSLEIWYRRASVRALLDLFAENGVPLENLKIYWAILDFDEALGKLKLIKTLTLSTISETMLMKIVEDLPVLQSISVAIETTEVSVHNLVRVLKTGRHLKQLNVRYVEMLLNMNGYNSILALAHGRVQVRLCIRGEVSVHKETLEANREWIEVDHF